MAFGGTARDFRRWGRLAPERFDRDLKGAGLDPGQHRRIAETLGSSPPDALSALVGYGLSNTGIARYHSLPSD